MRSIAFIELDETLHEVVHSARDLRISYILLFSKMSGY